MWYIKQCFLRFLFFNILRFECLKFLSTQPFARIRIILSNLNRQENMKPDTENIHNRWPLNLLSINPRKHKKTLRFGTHWVAHEKRVVLQSVSLYSNIHHENSASLQSVSLIDHAHAHTLAHQLTPTETCTSSLLAVHLQWKPSTSLFQCLDFHYSPSLSDIPLILI